MRRWQANLLLLTVALIWGSAFVAQSAGMASVGPLTFTGLRFLLGALVVAPLAWWEWRTRTERGTPTAGGDAASVFALGVLLMLGAVFQQIGIIDTTVTNAGLLTALYVPLVPLLVWFIDRRLPHWSVWPSSFGCVLGTALISGQGFSPPGVGDAWVIGSSFFWALHVLFVGRLAERLSAPFLVAAGQFFVCGLLSLLAASCWETATLAGLRQAWLPIVYTGVVSVGIGFSAQVVGQRYAQPAEAAIILSAETVFAGLFGFLLLGERLADSGLVGAALILGCLLTVQLLPVSDVRGRSDDKKK
ncbi:MAG TPA: DMT family transporter [Accumulibacter sp.]|nr:DMT family transporter [Accumulibacter sp.]HMX23426.1 DMT family transporter [Accumulibacter sp.]HNC17043.1 DMT family transporter [Accumulibacter sp.]HND79655.1 DMT family transporter [Accumulibacter sp.]HNE12762.1 DMT family transporter [Accumulibacter sp.]